MKRQDINSNILLNHTKKLFRTYKNNNKKIKLFPEFKFFPYLNEIFLQSVSRKMDNIDRFIEYTTILRNTYRFSFFTEFIATNIKTRNWITNIIGNDPKRILFVIRNEDGEFFGHLDASYNPKEKTIEVGNVVKGDDHLKGLMTASLATLCRWLFNNLNVDFLFLRVFSENKKAISLYKRCNFKEVYHYKVYRYKEANGDVRWKTNNNELTNIPFKYVSVMKLFR